MHYTNLPLALSSLRSSQAKATLISPFVGRIMDWWKKKDGVDGYSPNEDPGVLSVTNIYNYYKKFGHKTIVMGASFRNKGEILELAGCDRLTIAPSLLEQLSSSSGSVPAKLDSSKSTELYAGGEIDMDEQTFRWMLNEDAMATEKLAEGIRNFAKDIVKLEDVLKVKL